MNDRTVVAGAVNADGISVHDGVFLRSGSQFTHVVMTDGEIGSLEAGDGTAVMGSLYADGLTVSHGVYLNDQSRFADVVLVGADVGGNSSSAAGRSLTGR